MPHFTIRRLMLLIASVALLCMVAVYVRKSSEYRAKAERYASRASSLKGLIALQSVMVNVNENKIKQTIDLMSSHPVTVHALAGSSEGGLLLERWALMASTRKPSRSRPWRRQDSIVVSRRSTNREPAAESVPKLVLRQQTA